MNNQLIQAVEQATSAESLIKATKALATARLEAGIPTLIKVLSYNNPGAAVAAVDGLVALGEISVPYLLELLDGYNYGARAWAIRACSLIGDPRALNLLLEAASSDFALSVRRAAAKGLGSIKWSKLPNAEVTIAQTKALDTLIIVTTDPEWIVRYAGVVGLEALGIANTNLLAKISQQFEDILTTDTEIAVRARTQMALQQIQNNSNFLIST